MWTHGAGLIDALDAPPSFSGVSEAESKTTPLYEEHRRAGAKIIPFGGWLMPVQYTSISDEHQAVRNNVGVFDISHMGQLIASGARAGEWLNRMLTNNIEKLEVGSGQYTFLLNQNGGIIDDLIVYRTKQEQFLLIVNASRTEEDFAWLQAHILPEVTLENRSDQYAGLAIQGPRIAELFQAILGDTFQLPARNTIVEVALGIMPLAIARTGYTGEDGVEVFFEAKYAPTFWTTVLEKGKDLGIRPCGLGARDTLRLEMCYPLNGNDLTPEHTPLEAGLGFFVDLAKPNFTGREILANAKEQGLKRRLVPFRMQGKGPPPRPHYPVFRGDERIGEVNSGTLSPSLGYGIGMAYLPTEHAKIGTELQIEIRGQKFPAVIEKKPLYKKA
ncbi:MAG: glycine cleavage system aminomethyltransferase GcvT [Chthoniobacterales bacterium]